VTARRRFLIGAGAAALAAALPRGSRAGELALDGDLTQGGLVIGRVAPGSSVRLDGAPLFVLPDGRFLMGFARGAAPQSTLEVTGPDGLTETHALAIAQREFDIQRIDGLPPKMVTPSEAELKRIAAERERIVAARSRETHEPMFDSGFAWPAVGPISGVFGSQRILNGEPRSPHYGVDVAAPKGTTIRAPADGIVSLAEKELYYTGGTVIIDHGLGLSTIYAHMETVTAKLGDRLKQGDPIGTIGATGRVTGPHLHWGMNLFGIALDPQLVVGPMPEG
jgi:murein DD-endopeptidase MepM/ murein hydrolase activator NlpD